MHSPELTGEFVCTQLVTIYDLKITCAWEGELADGTVAKGSLTAIEVSHDMDEDEYVFESTLEEGSGSEASALKEDARKALADKLRSKFQLFPKAMIEAHGKDLLADAETSAGVSPADSGRSTPAAATPANNTVISSSSGSKAPSTSGPSASNASKAKAGIRTTKLKVDGDFMASADDLFDLLTNEQKVPSWSRNKATIKPEVGAEVSLFGGNISGKMTEVVKPTKFVQTWRAPTWPEGACCGTRLYANPALTVPLLQDTTASLQPCLTKGRDLRDYCWNLTACRPERRTRQKRGLRSSTFGL